MIGAGQPGVMIALEDISSESLCAAVYDAMNGLPVTWKHLFAGVLQVLGPVPAKDVCDPAHLETFSPH
jgi:hypothetical protein